jgi:hypothetical protein
LNLKDDDDDESDEWGICKEGVGSEWLHSHNIVDKRADTNAGLPQNNQMVPATRVTCRIS